MPGNGYGYPVPSGPYTLPNAMQPTNLTQARFFNIPEGGYDAWQLYSIGVHWKTGFGELVSSTAYFNRKVYETEDETDFVYAAITSGCDAGAVAAGACGAVGTPQPGPISEEKRYQRFVQEVRFASDLPGPVQFVVGGFYSDFHGRLPFSAFYPPATVPGLDATIGVQLSDIPNLIFASDFYTEVKEPAAFGEVSYQPMEALKLTAGLPDRDERLVEGVTSSWSRSSCFWTAGRIARCWRKDCIMASLCNRCNWINSSCILMISALTTYTTCA
jgi:hypothetical protein